MASLQDKLVHHLFMEKDWIHKGILTRIVWKNNNGIPYLPETVGRALRSAEESHKIAVKPDIQGKSIQYKWLPHERRVNYIPTSHRTDQNKLFKSVDSSH